MVKDISLRILLQHALEGTKYGLQRGKGSNYEIVQAQFGKGEDLTFDFTAQLKKEKGLSSTLTGLFVQGPPGNRFVYIVIGSYAGQIAAPCSGRLKVPLSETTFQNLQSDENNSLWSCVVPGRDNDGKPLFATVRHFEGWLMGKHTK